MQAALEALLRKRKDRTVAVILHVKERDADKHLPRDVQQKLRKVVMDQVNEFYDLVVDIAGSLDTGEVLLNDEYLEKIDRIHQAVVDMNGNGHVPGPRPQKLSR